MLVKISSKNQIAIPKAILEHAGVGPDDVYFDVRDENGRIVLVPMQVEERISPESLKRFESKTTKTEAGDKTYPSMDEAIKGLHGKTRH